MIHFIKIMIHSIGALTKGKRKGEKNLIPTSHTLPSSPSHSSSSDFEFPISLSPFNKCSSAFCVADELFYKGHLLPLQLSPRLSMVRTLASASASDSATTSSRDYSGRSFDSQHSSFSASGAADCDSSRPRSVTEDDEFRRQHCGPSGGGGGSAAAQIRKENGKGREAQYNVPGWSSSSSASVKKRVSATSKEVIRKYLKKVKPLYEKLSQKQQQQHQHQQKSEISPPPAKTSPRTSFSQPLKTERTVREIMLSSGKSARKDSHDAFSNSFSGNLRHPRRRTC